VTCDFPNAPLRISPDPSTETIGKIPRYASLNVTGFQETYLKVKFDTLEGYISYLFVKGYTPEFRLYFDYAKSLDDKEIKEKLQAKDKKRLDELIEKYGKWASERIVEEKIWIGMTEEMLLESLGRPNDINRTVTSNSVSKQYVYPNYRYVYVVNGKVTAFQD
jgi:hypothetical protein